MHAEGCMKKKWAGGLKRYLARQSGSTGRLIEGPDVETELLFVASSYTKTQNLMCSDIVLPFFSTRSANTALSCRDQTRGVSEMLSDLSVCLCRLSLIGGLGKLLCQYLWYN